jgi:ribosomal protein L37E
MEHRRCRTFADVDGTAAMLIVGELHRNDAMAGLQCKRCGAEVGTEAQICPKCGAPVTARLDRPTLIMLAVLFGLGVVLLFTPEPNQDADLTNAADTTTAPDPHATARHACRAALERTFAEIADTQLEPDASWLALAGDDGAIEVFPRGRVRNAAGAYTDREWLCAFEIEGGRAQLVSLTQVSP